MTPEARSPRCDFCDQSAVALTGETNGILVCERHRPAPEARDTQGDREALADWLGALPESRNVWDLTDEATTWIECPVEALANEILASDWLAAHVARARAEALYVAAREADQIFCGYGNKQIRSLTAIRKWLRARARAEQPGVDQ